MSFLFFNRIVFLRLSSLAVITFKIYMDATCSPADACGIGVEPCKPIQVNL